jgi:hypothetical protein
MAVSFFPRRNKAILKSEVTMSSSTTISRFGANMAVDTPKQESVLKALNNEQFVWRTVDGLMKDTNLSQGDVLAALDSLPEGTLATAIGKQGRLFTTRDHYYKTQSFLGRFLTAATGRFK